MTQLPNFNDRHGPPSHCTPATEEALRKYETALPDALLEEWRTSGWCSYAEGNVWLVDPDDFADVVKSWLSDWCDGEGNPIVFARSGFGDLLVSHDGIVGQLNVHHGRYIEIGDDVDVFLEYALDEDYVSDALDGALGSRVRKRLGALEPDEIYAFVPALAMGGTASASSAQKVKMFPHLDYLVQLFDEISIE